MVNGLVRTGFQAQDPPCVQIHHNSRDHWVMSIQIENGDIYFLDSLGLKINTSLEFQLCKIYGQNKNTILIKIPEVQKQDNSIDCGLFAIKQTGSNFAKMALTETHINYDEKYMRDHLIYCLERGLFSQFPKNRIDRAPKILKTKDHLIPINCNCGSSESSTYANILKYQFQGMPTNIILQVFT